MRWGRADTRTAYGGASTPQTVRTLQPTTACAASPARVGMLRRAGQRDGMRPCLACARGDATTRRPAGWDASLPRLRAWGCYLYAACLDRMQGASPARVGMLLPAARCCAVRLRLACARGDATGSSLPPPLHGAGSRAARPAMGGPRRSGQRAGVGGARRLPLSRGALPYQRSDASG